MTGSRDQPQNLSLVQTNLGCSPDEGDLGTLLPVGFNDALPWNLSGDSTCPHPTTCLQLAYRPPTSQASTFRHSNVRQPYVPSTWLTISLPIAGVQVQPLPSNHSSTLLYFHHANITFESVLVEGIQAADLKDILDFDFCPSLTFKNFSTSGCQARNQILDIVNSKVSISNSSFRNAQARGLSIIDSTTEIYDTVFENLACPSPDQRGGALFIDNSVSGNYFHIQASNFINNTADDSEGGAIFMRCANCYFEDIRFVNNTSGVNGGAVLVTSGNTYVDAEFENCFFANNTAGFNGVVYGDPGVDSISMTNCTFVGNLGYQGGALSFWEVRNVLVDSCMFHENNVRSEPNKSYHPGLGAALYVDGYEQKSTTLYVLNSTFTQSNGTNSPGFSAAFVTRCNCVGIIDSKFEDNLGMGLFIDQTQGDCESGTLLHQPLFNLSSIPGNTDNRLSGHISSSILGKSTSVDIRRSSFSRNVDSTLLQPITEVLANSYRGGAALNIRNTQNIMLVELHVKGNKALQGGGILLDTCTSAVIWSSKAPPCVLNNPMRTHVKVHYTMSKCTSWIALALLLASCSSCYEVASLGPIHSCALLAGTFTNNNATTQGGAIATLNNLHTGGLFIGNVTATSNNAATGGVVYGTDHSYITIANSSVFQENTASSSGGAVACVGCALLALLDVNMSSNQASSFGGALYAEASMAIQSEGTQYIGNRYVLYQGFIVFCVIAISSQKPCHCVNEMHQ